MIASTRSVQAAVGPEPDYPQDVTLVTLREDNVRARLAAIVCVFVSAVAAQAQGPLPQLDWQVYRNERFGLSLKYPGGVFRAVRSSGTGDARAFESSDGARLLVGAFANTERHTLAGYQRYIAQHSYPAFAVNYSPVGRSWFVLSGEGRGQIFYEKVFFTCGGRVINSFAMMYPSAKRRLYDGIVEEIEDSFRARSQGCP